jgi:hypothetical protein
LREVGIVFASFDRTLISIQGRIDMSQAIWRPPNFEHYTCKPAQRYQDFSHNQKIVVWLLALVSSWLMGLGVVKLGLMLYAILG